ncbi:MAG: protein kinase [Planctomycetes bacterium]|nr:protein kinase [Planctomycetota bacterium]
MTVSQYESEREWLNDAGQVLLMLKEALGVSQPGPRVPGFTILHQIAAGSQGTVYQAARAEGGEPVALKVLEQRTFPTSRLAMRLQREMYLAQRLDHPGIVKVLDSGFTEGGRPYLVMELMPKGTIRDAVPLGNQMPQLQGVEKCLRMFVQICQAVDHAHKRGVLHRDLKPSNVLFRSNGQPCVADFGLAKNLDESRDSAILHEGASLTREGDLVGSLAYAAPEQLSLSSQDSDLRSDVYSLGVILYELLTGVLPKSADGTLLDALQSLRDQRIKPASKVYKEQLLLGKLPGGESKKLPPNLDAILAMAMAYKKEDRYQTVADFAADIQALLHGQPVQARSESKAAGLIRWVKNHRAVTASIVIATASLITVTTLSVQRADEHDRLYAWALQSQDLLLNDALDSIGKLAGGGIYMKRLLIETLDSFEKILLDFPDDPALIAGRARAMVLLGQQQRQQGDPAAALASYQSALGNFQKLVERRDVDPSWQHSRSITIVKIGDIYKERGETVRGLEYYQQALELDEKMVREFPDEASFWDNLFWSYQRMGAIAADEGRLEESWSYFQKMPELTFTLRKLNPDGASTRSAVFQMIRSFTTIGMAGGNHQQALPLIRQAAEVAKQNFLAHPNNLEDAINYCHALSAVSNWNMTTQNFEGAWEPLTKAIETLDEQLALEPQNMDLLSLESQLRMRQLYLSARNGELEPYLSKCRENLQAFAARTQDRPDIVAMVARSAITAVIGLKNVGYPEQAVEVGSIPLRAMLAIDPMPDEWKEWAKQLEEVCVVD